MKRRGTKKEWEYSRTGVKQEMVRRSWRLVGWSVSSNALFSGHKFIGKPQNEYNDVAGLTPHIDVK